MSVFTNKDLPENARRNLAFQTLIAHRDLLQFANKSKQPPTYENAIGLLNELAPEIYTEITTLLTKKNDSELIQYFKELAEIKSQESETEIAAIDLLDKQIDTLQKLHEQDKSKKSIKSRLLQHKVARSHFVPARLTENRILNRDYNSVDRTDYASELFRNDQFKDYKLKNNNFLRIRFLHPDKYEHVTGADLIYEQYDIKKELVRFIFLQYKTWDEDTIYISQAKNLDSQMSRMKRMLCDKGYCKCSSGNNYAIKYRLPYCSGFIRPTDKLQENDSRLISTGFHFPICKAIELSGEYGKISKSDIKEQSFTSAIFEELFNENMIGSRWIPIEELKMLYASYDIFADSDRIILYAQEHKFNKLE